MAPDQLFADLLTLALEIAPELGDAPLYLLDAPSGYAPRGGHGATLRSRDCEIEQHLRDHGLWRGQGRAIVFLLDHITRDCPDPHAAIEALLIHELAHAVRVSPPTEEFEICPKRVFFDVSMNRRLAIEPEDTLPPWGIEDHGLDFIRAFIHLHARAWSVGRRIRVSQVWPAGLSPALLYAVRLGDEPERLAGIPFDELSIIPAPAEFDELFSADVAAWHTDKLSAA